VGVALTKKGNIAIYRQDGLEGARSLNVYDSLEAAEIPEDVLAAALPRWA
jgi:hypothetical protein